jgi:pimeloyl-ACP methyl ester carboxylesterase
MEGFIRSAHGSWPESGIRGAMANFEVRDDGTIAPWLTLDRHMKILRSLWEHRPSSLYDEIVVPVMLAPADNGTNPAWTADKRRAIELAEERLPNSRTHWFTPADHDLHAQHPERLARHLVDAVDDGFFV